MIERKDSQQTSAYISLTDENGAKKTAIICTCQIRVDESMSIMIEVHDPAVRAAENRPQIEAQIGAWIAESITRAQGLGIPVAP